MTVNLGPLEIRARIVNQFHYEMLQCNDCIPYGAWQPAFENLDMSKQLTLAATISVIATALFALMAPYGIGQGDDSRKPAGMAPLAEFTVGR
ncbi:MAG: hypothetical protein WC692_04280 [Erythrobacter sp.]|jgi:hypothetical protein